MKFFQKFKWLSIGAFIAWFVLPLAVYAAVSVPNATQNGDLPCGKTTGNYVLLHPGSDGKVLTASSTAPCGLAYQTASSTGGTGISSLNGLVGSTQTFATGTASGIGLTVVSSGSVHTFTPTVTVGFLIPTTASSTNYDIFWGTPSTRITAGTNLSWSGNTLNGTMASSTIIAGGTATHSPSITFATTTDTNLGLQIVCATSTCTFTPQWFGTLADARIASAATWNAKQAAISLTTTGTSGAATFISNTLNIPQYQAAGTYVTNVTGSGNIASSGGTTPNITFTGILPVVNGGTGSSSLNTTLVPEGNNLYFTNARAAGAISLTTTGTSGAATYNSGTGVFNIPNYTASGGGATTTIQTGSGGSTFNGPNFIFATGTPDTNIGLSITGSGSTITLQPSFTGTLAAGRLNSNVVQSVSTTSNSSTFTASISAQNLAINFPNNLQPSGNYITALTGDVTASGPGSVAATLATVNSNTGSFGSSTAIPNFTVNGKGLITAAGTNVVIAPAGTLTGAALASNVLSSSLTSVGTLSALTVSGQTTLGLASTTALSVSGLSYQASTTITGTLSVSGIPTLSGVSNCTGTQFLQINSGLFGCGTPAGGGGSVTGGTTGFVTTWASSTGLTIGILRDNGIVAGVNATSSTVTFNIQGTGALTPFNVSSSSGASLFSVDVLGNINAANWAIATSTTVCLTGSCQYKASATAADVAINAAITYIIAQGGGTVNIKSGTYNLNAPITIAGDGIVLKGENNNSTILLAKNSLNDYLIKVNNASLRQRLEIRNLGLNGNRTNQTAGGCIAASSTARSTIDDNDIESCYGQAIMLAGVSGGSFGYNNTVSNNFINNNNVGIQMFQNDENQIFANTINSSIQYHIYDQQGLQNIHDNVFTGVQYSTGIGVYSEYTVNDQIHNNTFDSVPDQAIYLLCNSVQGQHQVTNNYVFKPSFGNNGKSAITVDGCTGNQFSGNYIEKSGKNPYAYQELNNQPTATQFVGNTWYGTSSTFSLIGSGNASSTAFFNSSTTTPPSGIYWGQVDATGQLGFNTPTGYGYNFGINGVSALRVTSLGNVGIGTTTPSKPFEVVGNTAGGAARITRDVGTAVNPGSIYGTYDIRIHTSSSTLTTMTNLTGVGQTFSYSTSTNFNSPITLGAVEALRDGNDTTGSLWLVPYINGSVSPTAQFQISGNNAKPSIYMGGAPGAGTILTVASSSGTTFLSVAGNGSTTLSSLGTGCVGVSSGSLYTTTCGGAGGTNYWNNTGNILFNNTGYQVGINSSTPSANLVVQGSSTAPTIPIFSAASSSGGTIMQILANNGVILNMEAGSSNSPTTTGSNVPVLQLGNTPTLSPNSNGTYLGITSSGSFTGDLVNMSVGTTPAFKINAGSSSVSLGAGANNNGNGNGVAVGFFAHNTSGNSTAVGYNAASDYDSTAIGLNATAAGAYSTALGMGNTVGGSTLQSSAIGVNNSVTGSASNSMSLGVGMTTSQSNTIVFGSNMVVGINTATPIGTLTVVGVAGSTTPEYIVASSSGATHFTVLSNGNVGVGTSSPNATFAVAANCSGFASAVSGRCTDLAEIYSSNDNPEMGMIVSIGGKDSMVNKSNGSYDNRMLGIVSTNPAIVIEGSSVEMMNGADYKYNPKKPGIALAGRVPVKVKGNVKTGDFITSSDVPGVGMKATHSGQVIGQAMEDEANGQVMVFVKPGYQSFGDNTSNANYAWLGLLGLLSLIPLFKNNRNDQLS